jgi:hypothetical protein
MLRRWETRPRPGPAPAMTETEWVTDRRLLAAALLGWMTLAAIGVAAGHALGHDEAAYAVTARDGGDPWIYRSDGMALIARLGLLIGPAEAQLRLVSALLSGAALLAVFAVGRRACSARTGAWATALLAGAHPMVLRNAELLSDLPAMAAILGGMAVLIHELERAEGNRTSGGAGGGLRWRIVAAAPCFAAAFYVRYGSAPTVAIAVGLAAVGWHRAVRARPAPMLAMAAALGALIAPHLVRSYLATGSPLGILEVSAAVSGRAYVGDGLWTYLTSNPLRFYGVLVGPVMIVGMMVGLRIGLGIGLGRAKAMARRARPVSSVDTKPVTKPVARPTVRGYLAAVATAQLVALGLQSHGEARYVFVATALLVILGVDELRARAGRVRRGWPRPLALAAGTASWLAVALLAPSHFRNLEQARAPIVLAAHAMRTDAGDRGCAAVSRQMPQLSWYSRCGSWLAPGEPLVDEREHYIASFEKRPLPLDTVLAQRRGAYVRLLALRDPRVSVWHLQDRQPPRRAQTTIR